MHDERSVKEENIGNSPRKISQNCNVHQADGLYLMTASRRMKLSQSKEFPSKSSGKI